MYVVGDWVEGNVGNLSFGDFSIPFEVYFIGFVTKVFQSSSIFNLPHNFHFNSLPTPGDGRFEFLREKNLKISIVNL